MKILVIGGSYFLGRWFVQMSYKKHQVTVLNRGNIPIGLEGVTEITADRHNDEELCKLEAGDVHYDAVVDFCAYNTGDISRILDHLKDPVPERYIYVSTVDIYRKGTGAVLDESSQLGDAEKDAGRTVIMGDEAEYIRGKTGLEHELVSECKAQGIHGVSVRPVILYGPGNYAPRESIYLEWIKKAGQIIHPVDSDGFFQLLYVKDAAAGLVKLCEIPADKLERAYNFCTDGTVDYTGFEDALASACEAYDQSGSSAMPFERIDVPTDTVIKQGIPLPFPLTAAESEEYSGRLFTGLGIDITPLKDGLLACMKVQMTE